MRNFLVTGLVAVLACAGAFGVFYVMNGNRALHRAAREGDALAWLRAEFNPSPAQFRAIEKLHESYAVECGNHCAAIMQARQQAAPADQVAALEKTCVDAMTAHFRRVAELMPAGQGERYLATVLPRVAGYQHDAAPTLRATP
ncbi:MAG: hypothetical protein RIQ93_832 [Verrucomicrobiota bacterium]|jgi:hypothetical protein